MTDKTSVSETNEDLAHVGSAAPMMERSRPKRDQSAEYGPRALTATLRRSVGTRRGKAILLILAIWLPVAAITLTGYFWVKIPLDNSLIASETLRLVGDINGLVKARSSIMAVSADYLRKDEEVSRESLDVIFEGLKNQFPDFRSLELINEKGEITAMVGELPISGAGLASRTQVGRFKSLGSTESEDAEVLQDDPEAGLFFITRRHGSLGSNGQYVRAKFARDPMELTLAAAEGGSVNSARLIPVSGGGVDGWRVAAGSGSRTEARIVGDFWRGPIRGEALLNTKGWAVTFAKVGSPAVLAYILIVLTAFGAVLVLLALRFSRPLLNGGQHTYDEVEPITKLYPASAAAGGKTPFNVDPDPVGGVSGSDVETAPTEFWYEDYGAGDLFCSTDRSPGEESDDFFATGSTSEFVEEPDASLFGQEDQASQGKDPLQIAWCEPFGSVEEEESDPDPTDEVSADSGESFDRA